MRFELHREAVLEAVDARDWYDSQSVAAGDRFEFDLDRAYSQIKADPLRWPPYLHGTRVLKLARYPYLVIYRHRPAEILVVAIAHAKRRPGYWKGRLR